MKISDFAEEKGLTKQAIYKAISRAGFSAKQITDRKGNITSKGFSILRTLFPDAEQQEQQQESNPVEGQQQQTEQQTAELERLQERIRELEKRCSDWEQRYFDAVDSAKKEAEQYRMLLLHEQQLRMSVEKQGFIRRLFAGKKKDDEMEGGYQHE